METNISLKTLFTIKIIVCFYWLFGLQKINYKFDEFSLAGLQRRVYPTMIIVYLSIVEIARMCLSCPNFGGFVMKSIDLMQTMLITLISVLIICFDSFWHSEKKLRFYNHLNRVYNRLYESDYLKSKAIRKVFILYFLYFLFLITQNVNSFCAYGFSVALLHNAARGPVVDLMVLQILVETYFCLLGFKSLNENLLDFNCDVFGVKYLNDLTDFKRISICPNLYDCEWFEITKKRKQARNLQTSLDVYEMLMDNMEIISAQFGILFLLLSFNALLTCIGIANFFLVEFRLVKIIFQNIPILLSELIWLQNCLAPVLFGVLTIEALILESNRTRSILAKSLICNTTDSEINRDLWKLANLLKRKNHRISVYGISIDSTFIFSLVALTASYSIIVMQTNV